MTAAKFCIYFVISDAFLVKNGNAAFIEIFRRYASVYELANL